MRWTNSSYDEYDDDDSGDDDDNNHIVYRLLSIYLSIYDVLLPPSQLEFSFKFEFVNIGWSECRVHWIPSLLCATPTCKYALINDRNHIKSD